MLVLLLKINKIITWGWRRVSIFIIKQVSISSFISTRSMIATPFLSSILVISFRWTRRVYVRTYVIVCLSTFTRGSLRCSSRTWMCRCTCGTCFSIFCWCTAATRRLCILTMWRLLWRSCRRNWSRVVGGNWAIWRNYFYMPCSLLLWNFPKKKN